MFNLSEETIFTAYWIGVLVALITVPFGFHKAGKLKGQRFGVFLSCSMSWFLFIIFLIAFIAENDWKDSHPE